MIGDRVFVNNASWACTPRSCSRLSTGTGRSPPPSRCCRTCSAGGTPHRSTCGSPAPTGQNIWLPTSSWFHRTRMSWARARASGPGDESIPETLGIVAAWFHPPATPPSRRMQAEGQTGVPAGLGRVDRHQLRGAVRRARRDRHRRGVDRAGPAHPVPDPPRGAPRAHPPHAPGYSPAAAMPSASGQPSPRCCRPPPVGASR